MLLDLEQARGAPDAATPAYLRVIEREPQAVLHAHLNRTRLDRRRCEF